MRVAISTLGEGFIARAQSIVYRLPGPSSGLFATTPRHTVPIRHSCRSFSHMHPSRPTGHRHISTSPPSSSSSSTHSKPHPYSADTGTKRYSYAHTHPNEPSSHSGQSSFHHNYSQYEEIPFRPPPIRQRLKPLIPFFIQWCIITSLAVHLLRARIKAREETARSAAQISVLEGLIERLERGEKISKRGIRRELEMVGLREREIPAGSLVTGNAREGGGALPAREVGWKEAIFGRRAETTESESEGVTGLGIDPQSKAQIAEERKMVKAEEDRLEVEEWAKVFREADSTNQVSATTAPPERSGMARRAPSARVYL